MDVLKDIAVINCVVLTGTLGKMKSKRFIVSTLGICASYDISYPCGNYNTCLYHLLPSVSACTSPLVGRRDPLGVVLWPEW